MVSRSSVSWRNKPLTEVTTYALEKLPKRLSSHACLGTSRVLTRPSTCHQPGTTTYRPALGSHPRTLLHPNNVLIIDTPCLFSPPPPPSQKKKRKKTSQNPIQAPIPVRLSLPSPSLAHPPCSKHPSPTNPANKHTNPYMILYEPFPDSSRLSHRASPHP